MSARSKAPDSAPRAAAMASVYAILRRAADRVATGWSLAGERPGFDPQDFAFAVLDRGADEPDVYAGDGAAIGEDFRGAADVLGVAAGAPLAPGRFPVVVFAQGRGPVLVICHVEGDALVIPEPPGGAS